MSKLLEFFQGRNGRLSSKRLFMLLIAVSFVLDWQHAVWTVGSFHPAAALLTFVAGFFGIGVLGSLTEGKKEDQIKQ
ncbi:MAG TPA: hypothetical protein PL001_00065 [Candidatus Kryptobacter bacterium]|nr:hypothetical protein [Candidatus Kryptobacter bacterium]